MFLLFERDKIGLCSYYLGVGTGLAYLPALISFQPQSALIWFQRQSALIWFQRQLFNRFHENLVNPVSMRIFLIRFQREFALFRFQRESALIRFQQGSALISFQGQSGLIGFSDNLL